MAPARYRSAAIATGLCIGALAIGVVFGGNTTSFGTPDSVAEALCVPVLLAAIAGLFSRAGRKPLPRSLLTATAILALVAAIPLAQLVPLPPWIWTKLPGRTAVFDGYTLARMAPPWLGVSLTPAATRQALLSLIPALAVFFATAQLGWRARRIAVGALCGLAFLSVVVGLVQLVQGAGAPTRFYHPEYTDIVGFFANHNHFAALLYVATLLAGVWCVALLVAASDSAETHTFRLDSRSAMLALALVATLGAALLGIALTQSRAGFLLAVADVVLIPALTLPNSNVRMFRSRMLVLALLAVALLMVGANYFLLDVVMRLKGGIADSIRETIAHTTRSLIAMYWPVGAGVGSFIPVYAAHETPAMSFIDLINRAHDDFLEWVLEAGLVGAATILLAAGWIVWMNVTAIVARATPTLVDASIRRAGAAALALLAIHSAFDYPLRTISLMCVAALCAGMCVEPFAATDLETAPAVSARRRQSRRA